MWERVPPRDSLFSQERRRTGWRDDVFGVRSRSSRLGRAGEGRYFVAERIPVGRKAWRNSGPGLRCVSGLPGVSSVL
jgi:hypothetical protein